MRPLGIEGAWGYEPQVYNDDRGSFSEAFRGAEFAADLGYRLDVAQANCSVSRRGVIRGIHYADVPPGQAKYVTCLAGAILDVIVDLRTESPSILVVLGARDAHAHEASVCVEPRAPRPCEVHVHGFHGARRPVIDHGLRRDPLGPDARFDVLARAALL